MDTWQLKTPPRKIFVSEAKLKTAGIRGAGTRICIFRWEFLCLAIAEESTRHKLHSLTFTSQLVVTVKHFDLLCELQALLKESVRGRKS